MELKVLIVDDDPKIAEIHRHFTEKSIISVFAALLKTWKMLRK